MGQLLWSSVDTVVILKQIMRQAGVENTEFISLLSRLRTGSCNYSDFLVLNERLISNAKPMWCEEKWRSAPIIVSENAVKDALNGKSHYCFCSTHGP